MNDDVMLDARLRRGLQALPSPDAPSTTAALAQVTGRDRRPGREAGRVALVASLAAGLVLASSHLLKTVAPEEPTPAPSPRGELVGSWSRTVEPRTEPSWQGEWRIGLDGDGVLELTAPRGAQSVSDGAAYAVAGTQLRVDLFVNSVCYELAPGTYTWTVVADELRLTPREDDCPARRELLSGTWGAVR